MGLEFLRGNNARCPPVLVFILAAFCLYLLCSWWTSSSHNLELLKQTDNLAEQLRVNGEELGKCSQLKILLDEKLKDSQNKFVQQQINIEQLKELEDEMKQNYMKLDTNLKESKKKSKSCERSLDICHTEMKSLKELHKSKDKALETLRTELDSLKLEVEQKDGKIKELEEKLTTVNKINQETNVQHAGPLQEEKELEETKIYDPSLLSLDNDPREQEMRAP